ncbi:MAG TPA: pentapeptide repeat-containing protein [Thermoanaerobaculia bacterium]|nr:pentapeptide repeat-containing protein [Thermoanaerobaculia bacterium]
MSSKPVPKKPQMGTLAKIFGKHLPDDAAEKDQVGGTLARLKSVSEMLADVVEATKDLDVVKALAEASPWAEAIGKSLSDALPPVRFALKLFEELGKVEDPGELGYLAATLAYQRAVEQALPEVLRSEAGKRIQAADLKVRKAAVKDLRAAVPPDRYDFSRFSFAEALNSASIEDADRFLEMSTRGLGFDESAFRIVQHEVRRRFVPNLKGILSHGSTRERFAPFRELMTLDTQEARAFNALLEHADFQRWLYEEQPVLGREPFTLAQVYTETDCGVLRWEEIRTKDKRGEGGEPIDPFDEEHGGRHPLVETVLDLIADPGFRDAIVLQGVAGSGKSSLTLRLAWELVRQGLRPIRIELKHMDARESSVVEEALPDAVHLTSHERDPEANALKFGKELFLGDSIFTEHVLFRGTKICPYVLILDGWDEISIGASEGYQQRVERMLEGVRKRFLEQRGFPIRVILTGRPTQAIEASKFLRDSTRILTVRDLSPEQLESYVQKVKAATAEAAKQGRASWSLAGVQILPGVLERYREESHSQESLEILGLPLLAHLALRLLAERPDDAEAMLENTTTLYRSLVDLVVGQAGKPVEARVEGTAMLMGDELRELLRGTAEAMTTLGAESIPYEELAVRLEREDGELDRIVNSLSGEQVLSRLMISFFFKGGRTELGAEFSHKSFREYLFAEQVVELLKGYGREVNGVLDERRDEDYWKDFDIDDPRRKLCERLTALLGPVWITREVVRHLRRLLAWEIGRAAGSVTDRADGSTQPLSLEEWHRVRDGLADAWDWWGEGVHLRPQPVKRAGHWQYEHGNRPLAVRIVENNRRRSDLKRSPIPARTTSVDAHLGDGLFLLTAAVHAEIALQGEQAEALLSGVEVAESPRRHQRRWGRGQKNFIVFAPSGRSNIYFFNYCARINAGGYRPEGPFPIATDLRVVHLESAYLAGADLSKADLRGAILRRADLYGVFLRESNLRGADLRGAFIDREQLKEARGVADVL